MAVKTEKVSTQDLQLGMYVSQLDRPWIDTPFPMQGFHIRTQDDLEKLRIWCRHVHIDRRLGKAPVDSASPFSSRNNAAAKPAASKHKVVGTLGKFTPVRYETVSSLKKEVVTATVYHREITRAMIHLLNDVRVGNKLNMRIARKAGSVMVNSILRNPDAMVWLARIKDADGYSYSHSIRASILATVFGRHIGLPKEVLESLATGVLLMDVGKVKLPRHILTTPDKLTKEEWKEMKRHVQYSVDLLQHGEGTNNQILGVVQYHHERHDGSGYPFGLSGTQIPLLSRIAGIVDTYDAVTSERPWARARTSTEAVSLLYEQRDKGFQGSLVEQFIQSIGVYPTGTPVQLNSKEIAVVVAQNPERRLRPQVLVLTDKQGNPLAQPRWVDLMDGRQQAEGKPLSITSSLNHSGGPVDLASIRINNAA